MYICILFTELARQGCFMHVLFKQGSSVREIPLKMDNLNLLADLCLYFPHN